MTNPADLSSTTSFPVRPNMYKAETTIQTFKQIIRRMHNLTTEQDNDIYNFPMCTYV